MLCTSLVALAAISPALASWIPSPGDIFQEVSELVSSDDVDVLSVSYTIQNGHKVKDCTLKSTGGDDTDNFVKAVETCGKRGIINLVDPVYVISRPLEIELEHATMNFHGFLKFTDDIDYWIKNRIYLPFQNQSLAFVIKGHDYTIDGHNTGGIDGNGQAWYDWAKDEGNKFGRPMSFAISDSKDVVVKNWTVKQPAFWAQITIRSENIYMKDIYVNATSYNPESWHDNKSWLQNTDGLDTWISKNVTVENFVYQGGDDCIALKPNSSMITMRNITCVGGTGIALGSIAQYDGVLDIIEDVLMEDVKLFPSSQCLGYQGIYGKSWIGESHGIPPNGGGGGHGYARNITFRDVYMEDIIHPIAIDTTLTYLPDVKGRPDVAASKFDWYDIHFENVTGTSKKNRVVWLDCPKNRPCHHITFKDIDIKSGQDDHPDLGYVCNNVILDGGDGLDRCHPSNSTLEQDDDGTM